MAERSGSGAIIFPRSVRSVLRTEQVFLAGYHAFPSGLEEERERLDKVQILVAKRNGGAKCSHSRSSSQLQTND